MWKKSPYTNEDLPHPHQKTRKLFFGMLSFPDESELKLTPYWPFLLRGGSQTSCRRSVWWSPADPERALDDSQRQAQFRPLRRCRAAARRGEQESSACARQSQPQRGWRSWDPPSTSAAQRASPAPPRTAWREARVGRRGSGGGSRTPPSKKKKQGRKQGTRVPQWRMLDGNLSAMGPGRVLVSPPGGGNARRGPPPPPAASSLWPPLTPVATPSLLSERSHHSYLLPLLSTPPLLSVPREMAGRGENPGLRPAPHSRREAARMRAKAAQTGPAADARTPGADSRRTREAETRRIGRAGKIPQLQAGVALPFARGSRGGELDPVQNRGKALHNCAWRTNPLPGLECRALV